MSYARTALHLIGVVVLALVIAPFIANAVPQVFGADHSYVVESGSMSPTLEAGDIIYIQDVGPAEIQEGDIITFASAGNDAPTTHRVIAKTGSGADANFVTKGDANDSPDPSVLGPSDVIGEVTLSLPYYGSILKFAGTDFGLATFAIAPAILIILNEFWQLYLAYTEVDNG